MKKTLFVFYLLLAVILSGCFSTSQLKKPLYYKANFDFFQLPVGEQMIETTFTSFTTKKPAGGYVHRRFYDKVLVEETNYADQQLTIKNGVNKKFGLNDGLLNLELDYLNDQKEGELKYYYKSEELTRNYKSGEIEGVIPFSNNMKNGKGYKYYRSGAIKVEYVYKNGIETEPRVYFYENGKVKTKIKAIPKENEIEPYSFDLMSLINDHMLHGEFEYFDSLGNRICEGEYDNGILSTPSCNFQKNKSDIASVYGIADPMPEFPDGGDLAYIKFISSKVKYPALAKKHNIQGVVVIGFTLNEKGEAYDFKIIRGIHPTLANEALRVLKQMPKLKPGEINGKLVKVACKAPMRFKLRRSF